MAYSKFIVAFLGLLVTVGAIQMDEETIAQVASGVSALLVWLVPNKVTDAK